MKITEDAPLASYTSLKAGGKAQKLIELERGDNLTEVIVGQNDQQIWVMGYGTNSLISDKGLSGTVIVNKTGDWQQQSTTRFKVDSGCDWDDFIQNLIAQNLWGLEFTSGIPGGTGAAVAGNIAAYGHKVADVFVEASMLNTKTGQVETWDKPKFEFSYRSSSLQLLENANQIVLDATFELSLEPTGSLEYESALKVAREINIEPSSLANRRKIILETRKRAGSLLTDSAHGPWTAGSFFKNPLVGESQVQAITSFEEAGISREQLLRQNQIHGQDKARVSAALVLLAAGFKRGQTWGDVRLHPEHILKIENIGNASSQQIYEVVQHILKTVRQKLGIELEPEVRFLGEFSIL